MNKLTFKYGTMGSGKTLDLIARVYHERSKDNNVIVCKPKIDNREKDIVTRAGLSLAVDYYLGDWSKEEYLPNHANIYDPALKTIYEQDDIDFIFIDEAQFLTWAQVLSIRKIVNLNITDVICYGLKTDFKGKLFEGSQTLFELADNLIEIETSCKNCNNKANFNMKLLNNKAIFTGDSIDCGGDEKYIAVCSHCYYQARSNKE